MAGWDSYTQKATPEDNDTLMIKDTAAGANKRTPFSGVWNWMLNKLANAVISQLETSNKSIIPAINELNSKTIESVNVAPSEEKTFHFTGYASLVQITRGAFNIYALISVEYWSQDYKILFGTLPERITFIKESNKSEFTITNGMGSGQSVNVLVL